VSTVALLRERNFRSFFVAHAVSQFGDRISELAFPLMAILVLKATAGEVAVLTAVVWLPNLASVFVGAWIDRQPHKKRILVAADLARAALLVTLPIAYAFDAVTLVQLYAVALLTGAGAALFNTTYPAFFVLLVKREDYIGANSLLSTSRSASYVAGPALGGVLVQALTAPIAVLVDAVSFLVSATFIGRTGRQRLPSVPAGHDSEPGRILHDARDGLMFTLRHPVLRGVLGCCTTANYFTFVGSTALIVVYASRILHLSSGLIGLSFGVGAVGGLLGGVTAPALSRRFGIGAMVAVGGILFPASVAIVTLAGGSVLARAGILALAEFVSGIGVMWFDINLNSVMSIVIPDHLRARVAGAFSAVNYGVRPVGALTGAVLSGLVGLRPTLWVAAVGGPLCVLWLVGNPVLRARTLGDLEPEPARDHDEPRASGKRELRDGWTL
jgi:MFS family permease